MLKKYTIECIYKKTGITMKNVHYTSKRIYMIPFLLMLVSSCSVLNPHIIIDSRPTNFNDYTIASGFEYADNVINAYQKGMGNQAKLNSYTGLVMIPLSVATLNLGIKGNHINAVNNLTSAGVATYGLSTWLSNSTKSLIYAEGIKALNCVKQSILPYAISKDEKEEILSNLEELLRLISEVNDFIFNLSFELTAYKTVANHDVKLVKKIEIFKNRIEKYVSDSQITLKNGFSLMHKIDHSGKILIVTIDQIIGEINRLMATNSPSISALPGLIKGLGPIGALFKQIPVPVNTIQTNNVTSNSNTINAQSNTSTKADSKPLKAAMDDVMDSYNRLKELNRYINMKVTVFEESLNTVDLKSCGISEADIIKPMRAFPSNRITLKNGEKKTVLISGGSEKYALTVTIDVDGLTVSQPIPFGEVLSISLDQKSTDSKNTEILVKDTTGKIILIEVIINPESNDDTEPQEQNDQQEDVTFSNEFTAGLTVETVRLIQTALYICNDANNLPILIDGFIENETNSAIKECSEIDDISSQENVDTLLSKFLIDGLPKQGRQIEFERTTTLDDLAALYAKLRLEPFDEDTVQADDLFTTELRVKIKEFQALYDSGEEDNAKKIGISGLYTLKFPLE